MNIEVLFEDANTLVINKPVGIVVNRADSVGSLTVQDWVEINHPIVLDADKLFLERSGVCHRLDKETSGCLMIAKNPEALRYYLKLFKERKLTKEYVALVHGKVEPVEGEVILPMKRSLFDRQKWQVHYEGKRAETHWTVINRFKYIDSDHWQNTLSYLRLNLKTGRTHQIRVHLSFLGWPIFADDKYLNKEMAKRDREWLSHHFLHAERLAFVPFKDNERQMVVAPLPDDCERLLKRVASY
jgi:23S rRNA pseudouridine1911/1915/1917 synthase